MSHIKTYESGQSNARSLFMKNALDNHVISISRDYIAYAKRYSSMKDSAYHQGIIDEGVKLLRYQQQQLHSML